MEAISTDVLVVGGGPTGLMLASELALAGTRVVIVERERERSGQSKALNLQPRTAEVFDLRGLLDTAREKAIGTLPDGHFAGIPVPLTYRSWNTRRPYQVGIPQARVEQILEDRLAEYGIPVHREYELVGIADDEDGVTSTLHGPAGETTIRSAFLAGCDGGRSTVRNGIGVEFPGTKGQIFAVVADIVLGKKGPAVPTAWRSMREVLGGDDRPQTFARLIPLDEPHLYRFLFPAPSQQPAGTDPTVSFADVATALRHTYGHETELAEVRWASRFSDASRQAERYRQGRILLAGDAAHIHFPAGGQGLNLGIQDAMNLGWKLAAQVNGQAPQGLLDSYHSERHPVGARVLENTRAQTLLIDVSNPHTIAMRELFSQLMTLPETNSYLAGMVSGLDIRYAMEGQEHPLLGSRMLDVELDVGGCRRWSSDFLHPGRGVLLTTDDQYTSILRPWLDRVDAVRTAERPIKGADALLVRPDGYICWLTTGHESATAATKWLENALRTWFGAERYPIAAG